MKNQWTGENDMARIYEDNSLSIGRTPLIKLKSIAKDSSADILGKIEEC